MDAIKQFQADWLAEVTAAFGVAQAEFDRLASEAADAQNQLQQHDVCSPEWQALAGQQASEAAEVGRLCLRLNWLRGYAREVETCRRGDVPYNVLGLITPAIRAVVAAPLGTDPLPEN